METAIITGASKGIGRELTLLTANNGIKVIAVSRNQKLLESLAKESKLIEIYPLDINHSLDSKIFSNYVKENSYKINYLVNNAGILLNKPFLQLEESDWTQSLHTNLTGPAMLTQHLIPHMAKKSHIVNISSMGGFQGSHKFPGLSVYSSSKAALATFTECVAEELNSFEISINALCLGAVNTDMLKQAFPNYTAPVSAEKMAEFIFHFMTTAHSVMSGKVIPVTLTDPKVE